MLAYKFRSPNQIEFTLDILFNNRLYCADWSTLNDPMEGIFAYSYKAKNEKDYTSQIDEIQIEKKKIRICSLSSTFDCHLLWAHYAAGFSGMAIEIEFPDVSDLNQVKYEGVFAHLDIADEDLPSSTARKVLLSKYIEWAYEKEVRILHDSQWYLLPSPVRRIIVGHRMNPSLFEAMRIICEHKKIKIHRTGIGDEGIDADFVPKLGKSW